MTKGFETNGLHEASDHIYNAVQRSKTLIKQIKKHNHELKPNTNTCWACNNSKHGICGLVADAGSMYEQLDGEIIIKYWNEITQQLQHKYVAVAIPHNKENKPFLVKHTYHQPKGYNLISITDITAIIHITLNFRYAKLGNSIIKQNTGIPIGGPMSKSLTSILLCKDEQHFKTHFNSKTLWPLKQNTDQTTLIAVSRYVDDSIMISHLLCTPCIKKLIPVIYPNVDFEQQTKDHDTTLNWLDLSCHLQHTNITLQLTLPPLANPPTKYLIPPCVGGMPIDAKSRIRGTEARILATYHNPAAAHKYLKQIIKLWVTMGYNKTTTIKTWKKHLTNNQLIQIIRQC